MALFAQRTPGSVQQIRRRFDSLVQEIDDGLVEIQQAERSAVAEAHAADLRERDVQLVGLRTEVELLGHAATTAQADGLADQRALRAAQQQLVQVRAAHERDLAAQAARLGEENIRLQFQSFS